MSNESPEKDPETSAAVGNGEGNDAEKEGGPEGGNGIPEGSSGSVEPELLREEGAIVPASEILPEELPVLYIAQRPVFPGLTIPLQVTHPDQLKVLEAVLETESRVMGVVLAREYDGDEPFKSEVFETGVAVRVLKIAESDEATQVLIQSIQRIKRKEVRAGGAMPVWSVDYFADPEGKPDDELKAYTMAVISSVKDLLKLNPLFQEQLKLLVSNLTYDNPGLIMDLISSLLTSDGDKLQMVLETIPLIPRAEVLLKLLQEELQIFQLQEKIKKGIEEKISAQQKEFFLREQLKAIKQELGLEKDDKAAELDKFKARLEKLKLTPEAEKVINDEMEKLGILEPSSPEYNVGRTYLDWLTVLPWGVYSEDSFDIKHARDVLERDHFGLEDVKDRILEFLSTGLKTGRVAGSILCLVGPPGTGKTSIGKSVADALGRRFFRFSVGGMRDEAEIKGHRRTYIGAMPGKFLQSLKTAGTANPVIMLDEIDKIGTSYHGDPASALLEVLDPEQNSEFLDHYLDVRFDLSRVMFITTANQLDTIPPALLDRMEILKLSGYILEEKTQIAMRYLIPRGRKEHGLAESDVDISEEGLRFIIDRYAREAGVRNLETRIKQIMRKITRRHAEGETAKVLVTEDNIVDFLGQPVFSAEVLYNKSQPGVVLGLAWTSMGGATLYVEATAVPSKSGGMKQTGQLGDVMRESSEIAYSLIRSRAERYGIDPEFFANRVTHLHVPAGATPKDGPSAGITMSLALYSLAVDKPVRTNIAMTGEITLTGKVLPVGGIKEKIIAARRVGVRELILPRENLKDYKELPDYIRSGLKVYFANYFADVLKAVYDAEAAGHVAEV